MNETFSDYLAANSVDSDTVMQAARYYLSERCDDPTISEMREQLVKGAGDADAIDKGLVYFAQNADALEAASKALLAWAWDEPGEAARVERSINAAKQKLPVIEVGLLAMVAMYGMYLYSTGNKKRSVKTITLPDGTKQETVEEYYPPYLSRLTLLFKYGNNSDDSNLES